MDEHSLPLKELYARFNSSETVGLTTASKAERQAQEGMNMLSPPPQTPEWVKLIQTQTGFFSLLLWFGAILCFVGYGLKNDQDNLYLGVVLSVVVTGTGIFSYFQARAREWSARRSRRERSIARAR